MFDGKDLFPFVAQDLLKKLLYFPNEFINILKREIDVIQVKRKSLLFYYPIPGLRNKEIRRCHNGCLRLN